MEISKKYLKVNSNSYCFFGIRRHQHTRTRAADTHARKHAYTAKFKVISIASYVYV